METAIRTKRISKVFTAANGITFITLLFVAMFLFTAFTKLKNPEAFKGTLNGSPLLEPFASFLTFAVPFIAIFISLLFIFNTPLGKSKTPSRKIALIAGGVLMLLFTLYIVSMLLLYDKSALPCSCGGLISDLSWTQHIYFNMVFVGLAVCGIVLYKKMPSPQ